MLIGEQFGSVLAAAQSGAEWAFTLLYREFNPRLLRYLASQSPRAAEDLASETWLAAARGLSGFSGDEPGFRAWIFTIAHRRLLQHWRDLKRRPTEVDPADLEDRPGSEDPEDQVLAASAAQEAARAIARALPPAQAQVILLRVLGGLDADQVAGIVGKRAGTIRVLQHKALRNLAGRNFSLEGVTQ